MATVEVGDERFMFAPDVQGPMSIRTAELILAAKPSVLMMGGPPLYLEGGRVSEYQIRQALLNLTRIAEAVPLIILEHHALRDEAWRSKLSDVLAKAEAHGHRIVTAAEYAGKENLFLESKRKQLFEEQPVSEEFKQWMKTLTGKTIAKPPL
jgi:predicted metallo-beta-lactamase superfamily hydrolase